MSAWFVRVSADRFAAERLYHRDVLELVRDSEFAAIRSGDRVALVAETDPPVVFALAMAEVEARDDADDPSSDPSGEPDVTLLLAYRERFFDDPRPAPADADGPLRPVAPEVLAEIATSVPAPPRRTWMVSLDLPVEASSAAEAVREFWTYVRELGPAELPAFVSPAGDELSMQAFVLGEPANQDPEED
ncbi:MAG TPA: hypothetical protein VGJ28_20945 [Micromonosporaceae bacterium]|jgi:hypothetical protein